MWDGASLYSQRLWFSHCFQFLVLAFNFLLSACRNKCILVTTSSASVLVSVIYIVCFKCLDHGKDQGSSVLYQANQHTLSERWKLRLPPCVRAMTLTTSPILNRIWVIHSPICHNRFLRLEYPNALLLSPSFFYRTCNIRLKLETKLENYFLKHSYHGIITFLARVLQNKHAIFVFTATLMNSTHVEA